MSDHQFDMVIGRGKVTFTVADQRRTMTWAISNAMNEEEVLSVIEDLLLEMKGDYRAPKNPMATADSAGWTQVDADYSDEPVSDGIAYQPPKHTVLGGILDLGSQEPTER